MSEHVSSARPEGQADPLVTGNTTCGHKVAPKLSLVSVEQASLNQRQGK